MMEWLSALSPVISALIGVISYATLTNYRLDNLDKQVVEIGKIKEEVANLKTRVVVIENKVNV